MLQRDISVAVDINEYGIEHLHFNCKVAVGEINSTISELASFLSPFNPSKFIQTADALYYQIMDHTTDQEISMLQKGYDHYQVHRSLHSQMLDLLASADHQTIMKDADLATDLANKMSALSELHLQQEADFSRFVESLRFRR